MTDGDCIHQFVLSELFPDNPPSVIFSDCVDGHSEVAGWADRDGNRIVLRSDEAEDMGLFLHEVAHFLTEDKHGDTFFAVLRLLCRAYGWQTVWRDCSPDAYLDRLEADHD